jgi:hypothetical protein
MSLFQGKSQNRAELLSDLSSLHSFKVITQGGGSSMGGVNLQGSDEH